MAHDGHDLGQRAAQTRQLGNNERITALHAAEQGAEFALTAALAAAHDLRQPTVDGQVVQRGETLNLLLLVSQMLLPGTDA